MAARLCAFLVWAMVAASAVFWGLRLTAGALAVPAGAATAEAGATARGDLLRLFGAAPVQPVAVVSVPAESTRFRLAGVVAPRASRPATASTSRNGVALIAVDGKPARAYRVGARVDGDWVLKSVSLRSATVGGAGGTAGFLLELPPLPPPATGTLPGPLPGLYPAAPAAPVGGMPFTPPAPAPVYVPPVQPTYVPPAQPAYVPPMQPVNEAVGQNVNDTMPGVGPVQTSPQQPLTGRNINNSNFGAPTR